MTRPGGENAREPPRSLTSQITTSQIADLPDHDLPDRLRRSGRDPVRRSGRDPVADPAGTPSVDPAGTLSPIRQGPRTGAQARPWLDLRQVGYFVAVAEERSFTAAAARLLISQPSLSQQIRALERQVGTDLLERSSRGVRLTPAGRAFLDAARGLLADAGTAVTRARAAAGLDGGILHVATLTSLATWVLPAAVVGFRERFADVPLRITEHPDRLGLEEFMAEGRADVAVGARPPDWAGPVRWLGDERYVLVVPPGDPRAGRVGVPLSAFAASDWVMYAPGHGLRTLVLEACGAAGFTPRAAVESRTVDAAARLAAAGVGVALVPGVAVGADLAARRVELADAPVVAVVGYARAAFPPRAAAFLDLLAELPVPGLARPGPTPPG